MKKLFTLLLTLGLGVQLMAQLPDGSDAPNFISKDINGASHDLYKDYLAKGKPVVMDISATWCGPCWSYHNGHAIKNLYDQHGPNGTNKLMCLMVEGDPATNTACIYGPTGCNDATQGDWTDGTPYPIIDDAKIADDYALSYYPTIYLICPDRTVTEPGQVPTASLLNAANACKGLTANSNASAYGFKPGSPKVELCHPLNAAPYFDLLNLGTKALTSAKIELKWKGTTVQTINWTGNVASFQSEKITFNGVTLSEAGDLSVEISNVNGGADDDMVNNTKAISFAKPTFTTQKIYLKLKTDTRGSDTYWEVRDDAGNVVDHGGNEAVGPNGGGQANAQNPTAPAHPSAYGNNQTIRDTISLPAHGCYSFHIVDYLGNGITGTGYYRMYNLGNTSNIIVDGGVFGAEEDRPFGGTTFVGTNDLVPATDFDVYPNPAADVLNVEYTLTEKANITLTITNALGQVVRMGASQNLPEGLQQEQLPVGDLNNGLYFLNLRTEKGQITRKFTVAH